MSDMTLFQAIQAFESNTPDVSHAKLLSHIEQEMHAKYSHLHPHFYPPDCMQAKVSIRESHGLEILQNPAPYIRVLTELDFVPHNFRHWPNDRDSTHDRAQYILINKNIAKIGYKFVLKATLGPNFISIWFHNESRHWRLDLPLFYALEIINTIQDKVHTIKKFDTQPANDFRPGKDVLRSQRWRLGS